MLDDLIWDMICFLNIVSSSGTKVSDFPITGMMFT